MRIDSSGNVGIGDTSFTAGKLRVFDANANQIWLKGRSSDSASSISFRNNADDSYLARLQTDNSSGLLFQVGGAERLRITSTGNVGIGTSAPTQKVNILGSLGAQLVLQDSTTNSANKGATITGAHYTNAEEPIFIAGSFATSGSNIVYVGGGFTQTNNATEVLFHTAANTTTTGSSERMRITSAGDVGIGTSSPAGRLSIATDQSAITTNAYFVNENRTDGVTQGIQQAFKLRGGALATDRDAGYIRIGVDTANGGDYGGGTSRKSYMAFATAGGSSDAERMRIDSSGNLLIGKTTATANGGDLQVSSGITFPATQVAKSDANTLDDYEEGTWTPTVRGNSTAGTYTLDNTLAYYTKIGNQVTVYGSFGFSAASGGTGAFRMEGLPFAYKANTASVGALRLSEVDYTNTGASLVISPRFAGTATSSSDLVIFETVDAAGGDLTPIGGFTTSSTVMFSISYTVS
jgi:hypothetical protein